MLGNGSALLLVLIKCLRFLIVLLKSTATVLGHLKAFLLAFTSAKRFPFMGKCIFPKRKMSHGAILCESGSG